MEIMGGSYMLITSESERDLIHFVSQNLGTEF